MLGGLASTLYKVGSANIEIALTASLTNMEVPVCGDTLC